jgi:hypothetical protein
MDLALDRGISLMGFNVDWRMPFIMRGSSLESMGEVASDVPFMRDRDLERAEAD